MKRYLDQDRYPIYTETKDNPHIPPMVANAKEIGRSRWNENTIVVDINYPVVGEIFTLEGKKGEHNWYVEVGRGIFVGNEKYLAIGEIKMMDPIDYLNACHRMYQKNGSQRTFEETVNLKTSQYDILEVMRPLEGDLNYPVLDYKSNNQEGFHRCLYAIYRGIRSVPVIIIR